MFFLRIIYRKKKRTVTVIALMAVMLFTSLCCGQVLGRYLLNKMAGAENKNSAGIVVNGRQTAARKVLRLEQFYYYTIKAGCEDYEKSLELGNALAREGIPAVVAGKPPWCVMVGFLNNEENLALLQGRIRALGCEASVIRVGVNEVFFKFDAGDKKAAEEIAPFLAKLSVSLHKGLLLYNGISVKEEGLADFKPKFAVLAQELGTMVAKGRAIGSGLASEDLRRETINRLAEYCEEWAQSLQELNNGWSDGSLLLSQQRALALAEEYERFLSDTN